MHFLSKGQTEKGMSAERYKADMGHVIWSVKPTLALHHHLIQKIIIG